MPGVNLRIYDIMERGIVLAQSSPEYYLRLIGTKEAVARVHYPSIAGIIHLGLWLG
jgi:hypothetical protein